MKVRFSHEAEHLPELVLCSFFTPPPPLLEVDAPTPRPTSFFTLSIIVSLELESSFFAFSPHLDPLSSRAGDVPFADALKKIDRNATHTPPFDPPLILKRNAPLTNGGVKWEIWTVSFSSFSTVCLLRFLNNTNWSPPTHRIPDNIRMPFPSAPFQPFFSAHPRSTMSASVPDPFVQSHPRGLILFNIF